MPDSRSDGRSPRIGDFDYAVVIPLYNKSSYIERALDSIALQAARPRQIIVIDDGSTDDGPAKVEARAKSDPSIQLIRQSNAGVSAARNRGIRECSTKWVAFLDADDAYLPWFTSELATLAGLFPEAQLLATNFREVSSNFDLGQFNATDNPERVTRERVTNFYDRWWRGSFFFTSSVCASRQALERLGVPFPEDERHGEDLDLFFRLSESGPIAWTSRASSIYVRGIEGSLTSLGVQLDPEPPFHRLLARLESPQFPEAERAGARNCTATYWMTIARNRINCGRLEGAWTLLRHPVTRHRPVYWLRTAGLLGAALTKRAFGIGVVGASYRVPKKDP